MRRGLLLQSGTASELWKFAFVLARANDSLDTLTNPGRIDEIKTKREFQ